MDVSRTDISGRVNACAEDGMQERRFSTQRRTEASQSARSNYTESRNCSPQAFRIMQRTVLLAFDLTPTALRIRQRAIFIGFDFISMALRTRQRSHLNENMSKQISGDIQYGHRRHFSTDLFTDILRCTSRDSHLDSDMLGRTNPRHRYD